MIPYFKLIHNPYVLLSFISVCFFFIFSGNSAFEWPTQAEIPIIEKIINPLYLMNDFYTNSAINSPKIFFSYFIYFFTYLGIEYNQILYFLKSLIYIMSPVLIFDLYLKILFIFNNKTYEKSKNIILTLTFLMALPFFGFIQGYGYTTIFGWEAIQSTFALTPMKLSFFFGLIYLLIKFSEKNGYLSSAVLFGSLFLGSIYNIPSTETVIVRYLVQSL